MEQPGVLVGLTAPRPQVQILLPLIALVFGRHPCRMPKRQTGLIAFYPTPRVIKISRGIFKARWRKRRFPPQETQKERYEMGGFISGQLCFANRPHGSQKPVMAGTKRTGELFPARTDSCVANRTTKNAEHEVALTVDVLCGHVF